METHIIHADEQLDFVAKHFVPKLPCATIDSVFGKVNPLFQERDTVDCDLPLIKCGVWNSCVPTSKNST